MKIGITCHATVGGSGAIAVALGKLLAAEGQQVPMLNVGLADNFIQHGTREECLHLAGLVTEGIRARIIRFLASAHPSTVHGKGIRQTGG